MSAYFMMMLDGIKYFFEPIILSNHGLLLLIFFFIAKTRQQILVFGFVFAGSLFLNSLNTALFFDVYLDRFFFSLEFVYVILGVIFLYFGLGFCWDWIQYFKSDTKRYLFFEITIKEIKSSAFILFLKTVYVFILGYIFGVSGSYVYPPSRLASLASNKMLENNGVIEGMSYLAFYELGKVLPIFVISLLFYFFYNKIFQLMMHSKSKMIMASFYLSLGVSLVYLF